MYVVARSNLKYLLSALSHLNSKQAYMVTAVFILYMKNNSKASWYCVLWEEGCTHQDILDEIRIAMLCPKVF